jgi:hypothetical protein
MTAFWDIAPCSLLGVDWSVYSNETTRRYIPEGCHLHTRRRENLKSHTKDKQFSDQKPHTNVERYVVWDTYILVFKRNWMLTCIFWIRLVDITVNVIRMTAKTLIWIRCQTLRLHVDIHRNSFMQVKNKYFWWWLWSKVLGLLFLACSRYFRAS